MGSPHARGGSPARPLPFKEAVIKRFALLPLVASLLFSAAPAVALPPGLKVQDYEPSVEDLPVDMAWAPGTRKIFYTEKGSGQIRVMQGRDLLAEPCADLNVNSAGEQGALGLALHPDYRSNHYLYVYFSSSKHDDNRVVRFTVEDNRCTQRFLVIAGIPAANIHNGGQLEFMDGHLFISTGDASNPALAQDPDSMAGKILRILPNGDIPADNPYFSGDAPAVWSYGHRNAFGLAANDDASQLYESENGPTCDDELNYIVRDGNYGWGPGFDCNGPAIGPAPRAPLRSWTPTIAPTDLAWYEGRLDAFRESLLMGNFKGDGKIRRFYLEPDGTSIASSGVVYNAETAILDVAKGPGGWLYFLTPDAIKRIVEE